MRLLTLICAFVFLATAATITSNGTGGGNWASGSTWVGGVAPGHGDTAVLANGDSVTVAAATTATVGPLHCASDSGTGILVVNGTLIMQGDVRECANWTLGPGSTVTHDDAGASHRWLMVHGASSKLSINGTIGSRVTINKTSGSAMGGGFGDTSSDGGQVVGSYFDLYDWGPDYLSYAFNANLTTSGDTFSLDHCTIQRSGIIAVYSVVDGATWSVDTCSILSPIAPSGFGNGYTVGFCQSTTCTNKTSGTRNFSNNTMDGRGISIFGLLGVDIGMTVRGNAFYEYGTSFGAIQTSGSYAPAFSADNWRDNFVWIDRASGDGSAVNYPPVGTLLRSYMYNTRQDTCSGTENSHIIWGVAPLNSVLDTWIFDSPCGNGGSNDILTPGGGSAPWTFRVTNTISLLGANGKGNNLLDSIPASCTQTGSDYCPTITVDHSTIFAEPSGNEGGFASLESTGAFPTIITVKDNIGWRSSSGAGCFICVGTQPPANSLTADYNWNWNTTSPYRWSGTSAYTATPGAHDGSGDPRFVASSRNFAAWCSMRGASSVTACFQKFEYGTSNYDLTYRISDLIDYVRAGFSPNNRTTATASSTGGQVGAVDAAPGIGALFPLPAAFRVVR